MKVIFETEGTKSRIFPREAVETNDTIIGLKIPSLHIHENLWSIKLLNILSLKFSTYYSPHIISIIIYSSRYND